MREENGEDERREVVVRVLPALYSELFARTSYSCTLLLKECIMEIRIEYCAA